MPFDRSLVSLTATRNDTPAVKGTKQRRTDPLPQSPLLQRTLKNPISCAGIGIHSGTRVDMTLRPAPADFGIRFHRIDRPHAEEIPAVWSSVRDSRLCTLIGNDRGDTVSTIEHLMAALSAMRIDNILVELSGPEVPAMDGSSAPFVFLIECAGIHELAAPCLAYKVLEVVEVESGGARARLAPASGLKVDFEIDFAAEAIGRQFCSFDIAPDAFKHDVSRARTFGLIDDLPQLRSIGLGLGGSLENAIVVDGARILNQEGLRYVDEFVRHKVLDAIGDLALAGRPILGRYSGVRSNHALNAALVKTLLTRPNAVAKVVATEGDFNLNPAQPPQTEALSA